METAFALVGKFKNEIKKGDISVNVVLPKTVKEIFGGTDIHLQLLDSFNKLGILETAPFPVAEISETDLITEKGRKIPYDLLMLLPSFRGQPFLKSLGASDEFDFLLRASSETSKSDVLDFQFW